jgi:hypothetical protein
LDKESRGGKTTVGWAGSALVLTAVVAVAAKTVGVVIAPGARGVAGESVVVFLDGASGALAYTLTALLIALVCGASFELARARAVNVLARGIVVAVSGLVVALASPAVVERLNTKWALALSVVTSTTVLLAGVVVLLAPHTSVLGGVLALLAVCGLLRVTAWKTSAVAFDQANDALVDVARGFATAATMLHAVAVLVAAAWIGTRSKWRGRILANVAILGAFGITWLAARSSDSPSAVESVLRFSLPAAAGVPTPYLLQPIAAFLVPASILLAGAALLQPGRSAVIAPLAFALLSHGAYDVPLHALLVTASAQWAMLAMANDRPHLFRVVRSPEPRATPGATTQNQSA